MDLREDKLALRLPIAFDSFHAVVQCLRTPKPNVRCAGSFKLEPDLDDSDEHARRS